MQNGSPNRIQFIPHKFTLELKHPFKVSYGTRTHQKTLVIELRINNLSGYGECSEVFYYNVNRESWIAKLPALETSLEGYIFSTPQALWEKLHLLLPDDSFLLNAIDVAAHDYYARSLNLPLYKVLGISMEKVPITSFSIGIDTKEKMAERLNEEKWPIYKIKLPSEEAVEVIQRLRQDTNAIFRVDANCAWTASQTIEFSKILKDLNVEFIEQPLARDNFADMEVVKSNSALPIIADESCQGEEDLEKCKDFFHGINIKLEKCGGITPALRMIKKAHEYGLKVMLGCMICGTVTISAIAHLVPLLDYVDMDSTVLIKPETDNADGVRVTPEGLIFPQSAGTGVSLHLSRSEQI
jgi:L-alanine-DL-glutamate epimerase-like enolase superfamily enzyme